MPTIRKVFGSSIRPRDDPSVEEFRCIDSTVMQNEPIICCGRDERHAPEIARCRADCGSPQPIGIKSSDQDLFPTYRCRVGHFYVLPLKSEMLKTMLKLCSTTSKNKLIASYVPGGPLHCKTHYVCNMTVKRCGVVNRGRS